MPAGIRKRLGIEGGGVLSAEERDGALVLRPAVVMEVGTFSDADIRRWDEQGVYMECIEPDRTGP